MTTQNVYSFIKFDALSVTPKYVQLTDCILKAIEEGKITKNYFLPSLNDLSYQLEIGRSTAEKTYRYLKHLGVIRSVPGKGYFIAKTDIVKPDRIFLLFNKLSVHKQIIYDAFLSALGDRAVIDFYVYNNDFLLFKKLLTQRKEDYNYYVIIPHFLEQGENACGIINTLPKDRLILLDKFIPGIDGSYGAIYEHFEADIIDALRQALPQLSKYTTLKIIFPDYTYHPREILKGFTSFCVEYAFDHQVIPDIEQEAISEGTVYISLMEADLITLIKKIKAAGKQVGKEVGVISYNETPLKEIILNGVTTISTDFRKMGEAAAEMIINRSNEHMTVPFYLTLRNSL